MKVICLESLSAGIPVIHDGADQYYVHRSVFCLSEHSHISGTLLDVEFEDNISEVVLEWITQYTEKIKRSCKDKFESTEKSALAISFLLMRELTEYNVVEQAVRGTAIDYYMSKDDSDSIIDSWDARLEVSGIFKGDNGKIIARLKEKMERYKKPSRIDEISKKHPTYIAIIEHSKPKALIAKI